MTLRPLLFCPSSKSHRTDSSTTVLFNHLHISWIFHYLCHFTSPWSQKPTSENPLTVTFYSLPLLYHCTLHQQFLDLPGDSPLHKKNRSSWLIWGHKANPLNIKYHPSPGTALMRRKWHESCSHASVENATVSCCSVPVSLCRTKNKRCFHIYNATLQKKKKQWCHFDLALSHFTCHSKMCRL